MPLCYLSCRHLTAITIDHHSKEISVKPTLDSFLHFLDIHHHFINTRLYLICWSKTLTALCRINICIAARKRSRWLASQINTRYHRRIYHLVDSLCFALLLMLQLFDIAKRIHAGTAPVHITAQYIPTRNIDWHLLETTFKQNLFTFATVFKIDRPNWHVHLITFRKIPILIASRLNQMNNSNQTVKLIWFPQLLSCRTNTFPIDLSCVLIKTKLFNNLTNRHRKVATNSINSALMIFSNNIFTSRKRTEMNNVINRWLTIQRRCTKCTKLCVNCACWIVEVGFV